MSTQRTLCILSLLALAHCSNNDQAPPSPAPTSAEVAQAAPGPLLWKRGDALVSDLQTMLTLSPEELCTELGSSACAEVHRVPLGQSDPFGTGLPEPVARPLATSMLATERVVLSACSRRVQKDATNPEGSPFAKLGSLDTPMPLGPSELVATVAESLYHTMLARDPNDAEREALAKLAVDAVGNAVSRGTFAKLSCFAVATTSEFLLY